MLHLKCNFKKEFIMYTVKVAKECGCFRKSDLKNNQTFENKDDALLSAINMCNTMNAEFCQKHEFSVKEEGNNIVILVDERAKSTCCGGGHCS